MKNSFKSLIFMLISLVTAGQHAGAQAPEYFNYQALLRDGDNQLLTEQSVSVRFSILEDSESGEVVFAETHNVLSNAQGYINILVGEGDLVSGNFSEINWKDHSYYLKVEVDPDGGSNYHVMGTSRLVSVPYALHAGDVAMPLQRLEVMESDDQLPDEALFEVKRNDGSTVFAVYNEGVRVYVDDGSPKGIKGGFAVGGYNSSSKGYTDEYLRVTPDSVRIYINEAQEKGIKGGFAVGGYSSKKTEPVQYLQLSPINYFIGHEAGASNTSGAFNSFTGYQSGFSNTTGNQNLFQGYKSGYLNSTGDANVFMGQEAGYSNTIGTLNSFIGYQSGYSNDDGNYNSFLGFWSGYHNQTGELNTFIGAHSGHYAVDGDVNTIVGAYAGAEKAIGDHNTFLGNGAGRYSAGNRNTYIGSQAANGNEFGNDNIMIGFYSGESSVGSENIYVGHNSGRSNPGSRNIFIGNGAGATNTASDRLIIDGLWDADSSMALIYGELDNRILRFNGMVGVNVIPQSAFHVGGDLTIDGDIRTAGISLLNSFGPSEIFKSDGNYIAFGHTGVSEDFIGYRNNTFYFLDSPEGGDDLDPDIYIGGDVYVAKGGIAVGEFIPTEKIDVDGNGRFRAVGSAAAANDLRITADGVLTTSTSDARLKTNLHSIENALSKVLLMSAYTFSWKSDPDGKQDVGFLAQDLKEIFPEAVFENQTDGYLGINYSRLPVLLVEAIKEQQKIIEAKDAEIEAMKSRLERLEKMLGVE